MTTIEQIAPFSRLGRPWRVVCAESDLIRGRGVGAAVAGHVVAVFLLDDGSLHVIDDTDPFTGVNVLSRGLVGDVDGAPVVASPIYKQRFDLVTGRCLEDASVSVNTWEARLNQGRVELAVPTSR